MKKIAVILFNLGGPDSLENVEPFLFNLFSDPAIITLPQPFRWFIAKFIAKKRTPFAKKIYAHIGGCSPLLDLTQQQAQALESALKDGQKEIEIKTFVAMRYWHPFGFETVKNVIGFSPDQIIMLPLYPQFSTTTTESSFLDWDISAKRMGLTAPSQRICCYPTLSGFIEAQADLLMKALDQAKFNTHNIRVLFSAHGLPKKIVDNKGDPYPDHVELGAQAIVDCLQKKGVCLDDWRISYQSRVGPLEWIGPSTEQEIRQAGDDQKALVILPLAFVSEHSETLVELDIEYKALAKDCGIETYIRVPAIGTHPLFIGGLKHLITETLGGSSSLCSQGGREIRCKSSKQACPWRGIE